MINEQFFNNFTMELGLGELIRMASSTDVSTQSRTVDACGYAPITEGAQVRSAFGNYLNEGDCAVSRDLMDKYGYRKGTKLNIEGFGVFTVNDITQGSNRIEIFFTKLTESLSFGKKQLKVSLV